MGICTEDTVGTEAGAVNSAGGATTATGLVFGAPRLRRGFCARGADAGMIMGGGTATAAGFRYRMEIGTVVFRGCVVFAGR
jgi:hypothetical protein